MSTTNSAVEAGGHRCRASIRLASVSAALAMSFGDTEHAGVAAFVLVNMRPVCRNSRRLSSQVFPHYRMRDLSANMARMKLCAIPLQIEFSTNKQ
jgi:hypothetical protein